MDDLLLLILTLFFGLIISAQIYSRAAIIPIKYIWKEVLRDKNPFGYWSIIIAETFAMGCLILRTNYDNIDFKDPLVIGVVVIISLLVLPFGILFALPYKNSEEEKIQK